LAENLSAHRSRLPGRRLFGITTDGGRYSRQRVRIGAPQYQRFWVKRVRLS
jgi:hypothetical protein